VSNPAQILGPYKFFMTQFVIASELASIFTSPNFNSKLGMTNFFYYFCFFLRDILVKNLMECFLIKVTCITIFSDGLETEIK